MIAALDLLDLAERWIVAPTEAEWRSAISRAYYAAFHDGRSLMRELGFQVPRGDPSHAYLWLRLSNSGEPQVIGAGRELNMLRRDRNFADYDIDRDLDLPVAQSQMRAARRIISVFAAARVEPIRTLFTDAMKVYERDVLKQVTWTL